MSNESRKHCIIDYVKHEKLSSRQKRTNREYHVQHNEDVDNQDVKISIAKKLFPKLKFVGPHNKPHGVRGLGNNYHMSFYPKLVHGAYVISRIPCSCIL